MTSLDVMTQITARVPDDLARQIDDAAVKLKRSRAQVVRQALEYYLADFEDLRLGLERLQDPADPILDWTDVRGELPNHDEGKRCQGALPAELTVLVVRVSGAGAA